MSMHLNSYSNDRMCHDYIEKIKFYNNFPSGKWTEDALSYISSPIYLIQMVKGNEPKETF